MAGSVLCGIFPCLDRNSPTWAKLKAEIGSGSVSDQQCGAVYVGESAGGTYAGESERNCADVGQQFPVSVQDDYGDVPCRLLDLSAIETGRHADGIYRPSDFRDHASSGI